MLGLHTITSALAHLCLPNLSSTHKQSCISLPLNDNNQQLFLKPNPILTTSIQLSLYHKLNYNKQPLQVKVVTFTTALYSGQIQIISSHHTNIIYILMLNKFNQKQQIRLPFFSYRYSSNSNTLKQS